MRIYARDNFNRLVRDPCPSSCQMREKLAPMRRANANNNVLFMSARFRYGVHLLTHRTVGLLG